MASVSHVGRAIRSHGTGSRKEAIMSFTVKAFNTYGAPLSYGSFDYSGNLSFQALCDDPDTVTWIICEWKSGLRGSERYTRNRVHHFEIYGHDGAKIATVARDADMVPMTRTIMADYAETINAQSDAPARPDAPATDDTPAQSAAVSEARTGETDTFTPNPYWGEHETYAVFVAHADEINRAGFAIYLPDDAGRHSTKQVDFVGPITFDGRNLYDHLRDAGYGEYPGETTIVNYSRRIVVTPDEWDRLADAQQWPGSSEKFSDGLAERLYDASLDSGEDDSLGDSEGFGHYALFADERAILVTNSVGFVFVNGYATVEETREAWASLQAEHERYTMAQVEDALPTAECVEIFLIFDTARHVGAVADRDEVSEHVHQCRICLPYRYALYP
jgi:hypothetical protein